MSTPTLTLPRTRLTIRWHWVVFGGLLLASLDALFATGYWRLAADLPWTRVFQSVAAGVLGPDASRAGGESAAWLGLVLHYAIAMAFVVVYALVARMWPALARRPLAYGVAYGLWLYVAMNCIVIPLSAIGRLPSFADLPWVASSVFMHAIFGVICALSARRALR
ncbi:MAG TPA: DUF1440 domain-containing protein [Xanthomonadaceae bacterium]|nr:DUF1440 domain-containing protein [Xanthomonadaceae bacterium]